jgi:hypothetical protein
MEVEYVQGLLRLHNRSKQLEVVCQQNEGARTARTTKTRFVSESFRPSSRLDLVALVLLSLSGHVVHFLKLCALTNG